MSYLSPFVFGVNTPSKAFINRTQEIERLKTNFLGDKNSILISPRRWGKTSLVYHVADKIESKKNRICHINMQKSQNTVQFYEQFTKEVLKATSSKRHEMLSMIPNLLKKISPTITLNSGPLGFDIRFEKASIKNGVDEILQLPEILAKKKKIKIHICIDEFQQLAEFENSLHLQQSLRATWQHHKHVNYCLYGSLKHMMYEIFENPDMPFYKFGDIIFLNKISKNHWIPYLIKSFKKGGKCMEKSEAENLVDMADEHPYYVQYLAHLVWIRTKKEVSHDIVTEAMSDLFNQHIMYFERRISELTQRQIGLLHALINQESNLFSSETIQQYNLGTTSTVTASRHALMQKEIIDIHRKKIIFQDPPFAAWLKQVYFV